MSLFLNTSSLHNHYSDCCTLDVSETIERDCLSVLHKLHDQVNGLQLVQVVVQPLARLFNPASLAALVSSASSSNQPATTSYSTPPTSSIASSPSSVNSSTLTSTISSPNAPSNQQQQQQHHHHHHHHHHQSPSASQGAGHDLSADGVSTTAVGTPTSSHTSHSRSQSFASAFSSSGHSNSNNNNGSNNNSLQQPTSTYMMSPDTAQALIARLDTDRDVNWLMEIIGYGLSMPFSLTGEQDSVKDCCTIYCEWLSAALLPYEETNQDSKYQQLSRLVPVPIRKDPNRYARKMLSHLYNVFLPRQSLSLPTNQFGISGGSSGNQRDQSDALLTAVSRQAVLCHRVLRTIENIAQNQTNLMDNQTWDHLLAVLLSVNDKLLSAPTEPDDIGTQLHDRILGVLFELMLLASAKSIPSQGLWKTFHEMSLNWRHRPALVDHWRRITLSLTKRLVQLPPIARIPNKEKDNSNQDSQSCNIMLSMNPSAIEIAISLMSYENLSQTWYRFLTLIGNLVELSDPNAISRTDEFYHAACSSDNVLDPRQHPCLNVLPHVFLNSMAGLRDFIETFLGTYEQSNEEQRGGGEPVTPDRHQSARGSIISLTNTTSTSVTQTSSITQQQQQQVHPSQGSSSQQAVTPTQTRKSGIKSVGMKGGKVIPFTSSAPGSHHGSSHHQTTDHHHELPKSGSSTSGSSRSQQQQQFMQPRPSLTSLSSRTSQPQSQQQLQPQFKLSSERPKCNSILHIFGDWLFSAALIGSDLNQEILDRVDLNTASGPPSVGGSSTTTEVSSGFRGGITPPLGKRQQSTTIQHPTKTSASGRQQLKHHGDLASQLDKMTLDQPLSTDSFESGQAEAMAILCKIFSSKTSTEDVSPVYLSRFYLCLQHCLTFGSGQDTRQQSNVTSTTIKRQLLSSVLVNSTSLLQKDLDGINLLIPSFIKAIEFVFECSEKEAPIQAPPRQHNRSGSMKQQQPHAISGNVTNYDLRRACILTLLNLLAYPNHFQSLVIRNCLDESSPTTTFGSLRPRLLKLLFVALQTETDPVNMQILFGGLSLTIHDLASNAGKVSKDDNTKAREKSDSSSGPNSLEVSNKQQQDDTTSQSSFVFNSNDGFLIKSLHVTCHLLINIWKHDTQVSLAALELLTTIARVSTSPSLIGDNLDADRAANKQPASKISNNNNDRIEMKNEYKQTTKWICDYICNQCSRPPPAHSRDMHSTIVAAYQCLSVWFYNHPYLLNDENCVYTLMEVIELGVSGQKSMSMNINSATGVGTKSTISKGDKIMKPSSMRVREAAESLLNICMVRTRTHSNNDKVMPSFDTVLDEQAIAELFGGSQYKSNIRQIQDIELRRMESYKLFKYFSDEDSIVYGLFESLNHDVATKDSVICLLRTPFGKHCWKMKFSYYTEKSREKIIANKTLGLIKRPFQHCTTPTSETRMFTFSSGQNKSLYFNNTARFFPETCENLPSNGMDQLVSTLEDYLNTRAAKDTRLKSDFEKMSKIFNHQVLAEQKVISECSIRVKRVDCVEPQPLNDLEAARIIVTHLGLKSALSSLANGDKISPSFVADMKTLDQYSVRTCDSVSIFYIRKNRTTPKEILESVRNRHNVSLSFFEWILELGQPTVVKNHCRWTGKVSNSWSNRSFSHGATINQGDGLQDSCLSRNQMLTSDHGGAIFDGDRMTLYWSDMCQELAFLVPHKIESGCVPPPQPNQAGEHHLQSSSSSSSSKSCDTNIIICWLECSDDIADIPSEALLSISENGHLLDDDGGGGGGGGNKDHHHDSIHAQKPMKSKDFVKYFISPLKNGLYRINLTTSFGRPWLALPLVDGMTVSKGILSSLVRESILNLCRRRRLDADSYQPPHVKRRLKLQEICNNYKISSRYESTEFYNCLFKSKMAATGSLLSSSSCETNETNNSIKVE